RVACRRALQQTLGEHIVLLNNDTIVTQNWLNQLLGLVSYSMAMGMVGPMSNMAAPPQLVEPVPYRSSQNPGIGSLISPIASGADGSAKADSLVDVSEVESFAAEQHKKAEGTWVYTERLGGFCLLLKRAVLAKIGPALDEWSDLTLFDTDILSSK